LAALRAGIGAETFDRLMDEFGQVHAGREVTTDEFVIHFHKGAGKPADEILLAWLDRNSAPDIGNIWSIYSFEVEPEQALIIYGTLGDRAAQREAAQLLQRTVARRFSNYSIPIKADTDVDEAELGKHHLLLIGRPATNGAAVKCATKVPVTFGPASFTVRDQI